MFLAKEKIRFLQAERGLTTAALATAAKIDPKRLSHIICTRIDVQPPTAGRIAAALGVPVADIVLQDGGMPNA